MLDGLATPAHGLRVAVEAVLDFIEKLFVFPAGDPALLARGAAIFDGAVLADVAPVAA